MLLHIIGQHPGGVAVDYVSLVIITLCGIALFAFVVNAQSSPRPQSSRSRRRRRPGTLAEVDSSGGTPSASSHAALAAAEPGSFRVAPTGVLSYLFLLVIGIQGFHVIEHIVLVVQVEALGMGLAEAHGLLGARVDFEWLHFSYNSAFLGALILMLVYGLRHREELAAATGLPGMALAGAVGLQTYHVAEHVIRIIQYYQTGCTPCVGLIGRVVPFIWPHLFFGLIAYVPMVVCYFAYGLHRRLLDVRPVVVRVVAVGVHGPPL